MCQYLFLLCIASQLLERCSFVLGLRSQPAQGAVVVPTAASHSGDRGLHDAGEPDEGEARSRRRRHLQAPPVEALGKHPRTRRSRAGEGGRVACRATAASSTVRESTYVLCSCCRCSSYSRCCTLLPKYFVGFVCLRLLFHGLTLQQCV